MCTVITKWFHQSWLEWKNMLSSKEASVRTSKGIFYSVLQTSSALCFFKPFLEEACLRRPCFDCNLRFWLYCSPKSFFLILPCVDFSLHPSLNPCAFPTAAPPSNQISHLNLSWQGFARNISHDASGFAERASEALKTWKRCRPISLYCGEDGVQLNDSKRVNWERHPCFRPQMLIGHQWAQESH